MDVILPPLKRRRTRKDKPLVEGDAEASDAVTVEIREVDSSRKGKITKSVIVPLMSHHSSNTSVAPEGDLTGDYRWDGDDLPTQGEEEEGDHSNQPNMVKSFQLLLLLFFLLMGFYFTATILSERVCTMGG